MPACRGHNPRVRRLPWEMGPLALLEAWPEETPLVCLLSDGRHPRWSRWSIFASPSSSITCPSSDPLAELDAAIGSTRLERCLPPGEPELPFLGGWIGWLSYDLGRVIEPTARARPQDAARAREDRGWPLMEMFRCPSAFVHDAALGAWYAVGDERRLPVIDTDRMGHHGAFRVGRPRSLSGRERYTRDAALVIDLIRRGDLFQANLAHRISAPFAGSTRALAGRLLGAGSAWYGAYLESASRGGGASHALCSVSPELFLSLDPRTRRVVTRPIKGTRPASADPGELVGSGKDQAELAMIVDLMRNDLGRVCEYASVRVDDPRSIERHAGAGGVQHGVATVSGTLRPGVSFAGLLRAAFPPGSVTGAPKIRAMQVIDAMEPVRRGPYCGSIGYVSDCGRACWSVAIRTAAVRDARLDFSVGAGIVADSDPQSEWLETLAKAGVLRGVLRRSRGALGAAAGVGP